MCDAYVGSEWEAGIERERRRSWKTLEITKLVYFFHRAAVRDIPSNAILVRPAIGQNGGGDKPRKRRESRGTEQPDEEAP